MKRTGFLLGIAGASLMTVATCSEQKAGNNVATTCTPEHEEMGHCKQ